MRPPEPAAADGSIAPAVAPTGLAEQRELSWLPLRSLFSGAVLRAVSSKLSAHSYVDKSFKATLPLTRDNPREMSASR